MCNRMIPQPLRLSAPPLSQAQNTKRLPHAFGRSPGRGVFALADAGRVFLTGESSDRWHTGVGGGVWFAFLETANTITVAVARGDGRTALYLRAGFAY
jgi:hypothetical protein